MNNKWLIIIGFCVVVICLCVIAAGAGIGLWISSSASKPQPPVCSASGQTWTSPLDGMQIVCVPPGEFLMGSTDVQVTQIVEHCVSAGLAQNVCEGGFSSEGPQHTVFLDAYWMDKYEVSNGQYQKCVAAGGCTQPWDTSSDTRPSYFGNEQYANYPVIQVDWNQASAYCKWAGRQLPTEAQWEKAARGTDGRTYPWGEGIDCQKANYMGKPGGCTGDTTEVGNYPQGASLYGAMDLAGNVMEWVNDWYGEEYYSQSPTQNPSGPSSGEYRVLRGGSLRDGQSYTRSAARTRDLPGKRLQEIGFRCVSSP